MIETIRNEFDLAITSVKRDTSEDRRTKYGYSNGYNVRLMNIKTGVGCNFAFHDSIMNSQAHKAPSITDMLYCYVLDARSFDSTRSFNDFVNEFGYDISEGENSTGYREALKAFNGCKQAYHNLQNLVGINLNKLIDRVNEFDY